MNKRVTKRQLAEELDQAQRQLEEIQKAVAKHERGQNCHLAGPLGARVRQVLEIYERSAVEAVDGVKQFREDLVVQFRALALADQKLRNCLATVGP